MKRAWFKRKTYGWGWVPATWEGWLMIGLYTVGVVYVFRTIDAGSHSVSDTLIGTVVPFMCLTAILVVVCYVAGEKPRWQWGDKSGNKKE